LDCWRCAWSGLGAILGFVLAVVLLKNHWVDCENWDLFAVWEGRLGQKKKPERRARFQPSVEYRPVPRPKSKKKKAKNPSPQIASLEDPATAALRAMQQHLDLGEVEAALGVYNRSSRSMATTQWQPPERDWRLLIDALLKQGMWNEAVLVMRDYVCKQADPSPRVRLKLAQILIQKLERPIQGLKVLEQIRPGSLPESLEAMRRQLGRQAEALQEEGPLELEDELW
jgi:hypothetical protein